MRHSSELELTANLSTRLGKLGQRGTKAQQHRYERRKARHALRAPDFLEDLLA